MLKHIVEVLALNLQEVEVTYTVKCGHLAAHSKIVINLHRTPDVYAVFEKPKPMFGSYPPSLYVRIIDLHFHNNYTVRRLKDAAMNEFHKSAQTEYRMNEC